MMTLFGEVVAAPGVSKITVKYDIRDGDIVLRQGEDIIVVDNQQIVQLRELLLRAENELKPTKKRRNQ